jgi:uroporphyrinogen decarboxylase
MLPRERVLAVVEHQLPDRVPHFEFSHSKRTLKALTHSGTYEELVEVFDLDAVVCAPNYQRINIGNDLIRDEWGVVRQKGLEEYAVPVEQHAPIKTMQDLENWIPPDPYASHRFDTAKSCVQRFKGQRAIFIVLRDVWSHPRDLMGYETMLIACMREPDLVRGLIEKCMDHTIRVAEIAADLGVEFVVTGDDIADSRTTLISPSMWEELFLPYFKKLVDAFHDNGLYFWKHSDGNIMPVLDSLVDAGIDGIDPVDPLGSMDLAAIKQQYGNAIAIKGNVDCVNLLPAGTKEEIITAVKDCIKKAGAGGGYVCSSSNSIHTGVEPGLYKTMVEAIHTYGVYPLEN